MANEFDTTLLEGTGELSQQEIDKLYRGYLNAMYVMVKSALVFDINNEALHAACDKTTAIANSLIEHADGQAAISFLQDGVFVNRNLLRLDGGSFEQGAYLFTVWNTFRVGEIAAVGETTRDDWLTLMAAFKGVAQGAGSADELRKQQYPNINLTELNPEARAGAGTTVSATDRFRALRAYAITGIALSELIDAARTGKRVKSSEVKRPLQEIISLTETSESLLLALVHMKRNKQDLHHALVNTAVLTVCMGHRLGVDRIELCDLGMRGLFHDLGRAFLAHSNSGPDFERDCALESVCKLVRSGAVNRETIGRMVVANEVRRWADAAADTAEDAYPFDIGASTRLIAVARAYDRLTTPTATRVGLLPDEALRIIVAESGRRYDARAVQLLVSTLGIYPVGSVVELSDGSVAIVTEAPHTSKGSDRPRVKVVRDAMGTELDGALLDLSGPDGAHLNIRHCLDAEEQSVNTPAFLLA